MTAPSAAELVERLDALLRNELATRYPLMADVVREARDALAEQADDVADLRKHYRVKIAALEAANLEVGNRCADLIRENAEQSQEIARLDSRRLDTALERIAALERELAEAKKDAERYRWLRTVPKDGVVLTAEDGEKYGFGEGELDETIDRCIDAARGAEHD